MVRPVPLREMVQCKDLTCTDPHFYVAAWALFTYLTNVKHADTVTYIDLVAHANLDELDGEMRRWLVNGSHQILHYNVKLPSFPVTERTLSDADVHAIRALLRLQFQEDKAIAKEQAEAALALDPTHVLATFIRYRVVKTIEPAAARAVATAHPDDWRAQMMLAWSSKDDAEAHSAWVRGCELAAQNRALVTKCPTN